MAIYFAYGSNLDAQNWAEFCARYDADPACMKPIGTAWLPDCELVFNYRSVLRAGGALNIRERKGHFVHGALFEVTELGWEVLDIKESVAKGCYTRIEHMAIMHGGRPLPVTTYQVTPQRQEGFVPPSDEYSEIVSRGLKAFGLPSTQYENAARNQRSEPDAEGVFVYGTLMRGETNHDAIRQHDPEETLRGRARGRLHATAADYPMLDVHEHQVHEVVHGEFMRFFDAGPVLETLDEVETFGGYARDGNEYVRTLVEVDTGHSTTRLAWTYVVADRSIIGERIESGCWRTHRGIAPAAVDDQDAGQRDTEPEAIGE
ncbi:MAG: gamma-glutamylcyclotransferase [Betaproteobacteria bacterium]|nr:MAG: gamma-glutamylcyclotransferase [Betaproteobacteria bacterium]